MRIWFTYVFVQRLLPLGIEFAAAEQSSAVCLPTPGNGFVMSIFRAIHPIIITKSLALAGIGSALIRSNITKEPAKIAGIKEHLSKQCRKLEQFCRKEMDPFENELCQ